MGEVSSILEVLSYRDKLKDSDKDEDGSVKLGMIYQSAHGRQAFDRTLSPLQPELIILRYVVNVCQATCCFVNVYV